jgi:hypothetical protein
VVEALAGGCRKGQKRGGRARHCRKGQKRGSQEKKLQIRGEKRLLSKKVQKNQKRGCQARSYKLAKQEAAANKARKGAAEQEEEPVEMARKEVLVRKIYYTVIMRHYVHPYKGRTDVQRTSSTDVSNQSKLAEKLWSKHGISS